MKEAILTLFFPILVTCLFAQQKTEADQLVGQGVALEDSGKSDLAIARYQQALELDRDNLAALTEMAYSLMTLNKYSEVVKYCKRAIKTHKGEQGLNTVYVSYGNALDAMKESKNSIEIYNEGLRLFPDDYQLYFNKGITLAGISKNGEAIICFQRSATINPNHASSHNAIGNISLVENIKIPALMAYSRFLVLEPETRRSINCLANLQTIMQGNATATGENSVTIRFSPEILGVPNEKNKANNFSSTELLLNLASALDNDSSNRNKTAVEKFIRKFDLVCSSLKETEKDNYGFYWDYYVPYFTEMKDRGMVETFAYIIFASSEDQNVTDWLKSHQTDIEKFYKWTEDFKWRIN